MQESQVTAVSIQRPAPARRRSRSLFSTSSPRSGFTLTELLVVIAIIAVLAGLIATAAVRALYSARRARIVLEIKNVSGAIENFKNDYGVYPPNGMNNSTPAQLARVEADFVRAFKKAFPRANPQEEQVVRALAGRTMTGGSNAVVTDQNTGGGMKASEALFFWLGGFSADEQFPLSGPGGPSYVKANGPSLESRNVRYDFDLGKLQPRVDEDGDLDFANVRYVEYGIDLDNNGNRTDPGEQRRIDLWTYTPPSSTQPLIYIDTSRYKPAQYDQEGAAGTGVFAFKSLKAGAPTPPKMEHVVFTDDKFQVLHCGLDGDWGNFGVSAATATDPNQLLLYPAGPFIGPIADTLTNFTEGELADEAE